MEQNIQQIYDPNFRVEQIPLNDPKTNRLLSEAKVAGIFQLESPGMMATLEKVKVDCFTDLVDVISLFRPGPMSNFPKYLKNKANPQLIPHINEAYDQVIRQSHGIIIYQEQIMEIVQKVAGLSFAQADILRKAISKKNRIEIAEMQALFIKGALNQGTPLKVAEQIYHEIEKFAQYGFNKSHAVAYATVSYKMAYLKTKFPICFYSVLINLTAAVESINRYVKEARLLRFNIESPSVNKVSQEILHNKKDTIWLPISFIKGIGMAVMQKLIKELATNGPFQSFFDFICRAKMINLGNSAIDILIEANALREFGNMKTLMHNKTQAFNYAAVALTQDKTSQT